MRPIRNHIHKARFPTFLMTTTAIQLFGCLLVITGVSFGLYVRVASKNSETARRETSEARVTVQAGNRGKPYLNFKDGREMSITYRGDQQLVTALQSGSVASRELVSADFDQNGTPDVVAGYAWHGSGMVTLQRGNPDAFAPEDDSIFVRMQQGYNPDSLLPDAEIFPVPVSPDFMAVGNFGHAAKDLLIGAKGGGLYLMEGDGTGGFDLPMQIPIPGAVTTLAAGEFRAADGFSDVAVGVSGPSGNALMIFDGAAVDFSKPLFEYPLAEAASAIEFGGLDDDPFLDVAVATGNEILVVHGWGRKEQVQGAASRVERFTVGSIVRGLAVGEFAWDRQGRSEMAALTDDGAVQIIQQEKVDKLPFTEAEAVQRTKGKLKSKGRNQPVDVESVPSWQRGGADGWAESNRFVTSSFAGVNSAFAKPLLRTNLSYQETDDLVLIGGSQSKLEILHPIGPNETTGDAVKVADGLIGATLDVESAPVAVLPLPRKLNGERDLVVLNSTSTAPTILPNPPNTTINVDRTDDPSGAALTAASACTAAANDCSLRGALQFANLPANDNTTINLPANTYILSINGTNAGGCDGNTVGDLGANRTMSIVGAGAATTIIRQTGTGLANDGDRVMCMNEPFTLNLIYNFSGFTMVGGRDGTAAGTGTALGGGGIIGGEKGNVLTMTNVVLANNQVTVLGSANIGGGGIQWTGGDMNVTNCTIGGSAVPGAYTDRTSTNTANLQAGSGGGVMYTPSAPQHSASTGILTVSGTTFSRNTAGSTGSGGGGLNTVNFAFAAPGSFGSGSATVGTTTFSNNQAVPGNGGGILVESLPTTVATTSLTNNSAGNRGGGIYVGGGSLLLSGTTPSITFSGNTATNAGSSVSTSAPVNVDGTNTTISGDIELNLGGTWTNNAGSSLAPTNVVVAGGTFNMNNSTMNVGGNLTIGPSGNGIIGGTFNGNTGTVNIQGNFVLNAGGAPATTLNAGTGTFNFNGTSAQSISNGTSITFFNLTDSNVTQPLTANNSFNVNGSLNVNGASAIFNPVAAAVIGGTGTLTGTGTARVTRTAATADFSSQYTITNKTLTNLLVDYVGGAAQVLSSTTYGPLRINNASGVSSAAGTATVNGLLTLQAGALNVGTSTLVINNGTAVAAGSITSSPTGTVNYNQGSAGQDVRAFNYGNLTFSNQNKVLASTGTIAISGAFTPGSGVHTITGSTIDFNGTGAQTINAFNYNNLTISNARTTNNVTLASGVIGVLGAFNPTATFSSGTFIITGNTIDFNGSGSQTIPAFNYNNLTSSNTGARTLAGAGTIRVFSVFTPGGNAYTIAGSTVDFNGTGAQTVNAFNFNSLSISGARTTNSVTLASGTIGVAGIFSPTAIFTTGNYITTGNTIDFNGSGSQAIPAFNYNNLMSSNVGARTLASGGTIGIAAVFTPGTNSYTIAGNTINFNGSGAQTIPAFNYNNLTSSNAGARTLAGSGSVGIAGVFTPGTNLYTTTGSTVVYNGGSPQTMPATFTTYNNLTLNNPNGVTGFAGLTVQGLLRVQAGTFTSSSNYNDVQIDAGATMTATAASTINVTGNWTTNGTFNASTGTVVFNGSNNMQTLSGSTTFNNLTVNHTGTGNVTAAGSTLVVSSLLRVQAGTLISASTFNNVQIDSGTTLQGTNATTMNVSGNWVNNGGTFIASGNTVNFNGAGAQSISGTSTTQAFDNFSVNKSGGSTLIVAASTNTLDINGNVTLTLGNLAAGTATAISVAGNWTNNGGAFNGNSGAVSFDGGVGQVIGGNTATTFNNLTNSNAAGISMANDNAVNGALVLTSSDITVAATKTLTQPVAGTSSGGFDVNGRVQRTGFVTGGAALSFGNPFNTIQVTAGVAPANIVVDLARSVPTGPQAFPTAIQRTYTITPSAAGFTGTLRLHYLDTELNGNVEGASFILRRFNGAGWMPVLPTSTDFAANWLEATGVTQFSPWTLNSTAAPTASNGVVTGRIVDVSGNPVEGAVLRLQGTQNRKFITDANGVYRFENVDTAGFYTVTPSRVNYTFNPSERSFSQLGETTQAAFGATLASSNFVNPLDTPEYFVRQHYVDFLGREPDEAGFNFWSDQIIECGADQNCIERRRENVSAAYFLSIEFRRTGGVVDGLYRAAYGARPTFAQFMPDARTIGQGVRVNQDGWEALLAANTEAFVNNFVNRAEFHQMYDSMGNTQYVDTLIGHTGVSFTSAERDALVSGLTSGSMTRAEALRSIAENERFVQAKFNETFVMMEYFGYLRRDADASGFAFWLNKLNQFNGNFEQAEMVKAFIVSGEYRDRFPR